MSVSLPYWHVLLRHFESKGYISNGLTIPFLIGARSRMEPKTSRLKIKELVNSINEVGGTILECSNIGEFVIGTTDTETIKYKSHLKCIDNIIITDTSLDKIDNLDELISHFEKRYQVYLDNCEFSKNDGKWTKFTAIDKERIDEIKYA